jgi:hypothetical protein
LRHHAFDKASALKMESARERGAARGCAVVIGFAEHFRGEMTVVFVDRSSQHPGPNAFAAVEAMV